jgi:hypothetical protein
VITALPVNPHRPGPLPPGLCPDWFGELFILMAYHQEIAQQHHSADPSEEYRLRQGKLRAGDYERSKDRQTKTSDFIWFIVAILSLFTVGKQVSRCKQ